MEYKKIQSNATGSPSTGQQLVDAFNENFGNTAFKDLSNVEDSQVYEKIKSFIAQLLLAYINDAKYDSALKRINFLHNGTVVCFIDAEPFVLDGMVDDVDIQENNLVIIFNTAAQKKPIEIPLEKIFNPANYYTKKQTDEVFLKNSSLTQETGDNPDKIMSQAVLTKALNDLIAEDIEIKKDISSMNSQFNEAISSLMGKLSSADVKIGDIEDLVLACQNEITEVNKRINDILIDFGGVIYNHGADVVDTYVYIGEKEISERVFWHPKTKQFVCSSSAMRPSYFSTNFNFKERFAYEHGTPINKFYRTVNDTYYIEYDLESGIYDLIKIEKPDDSNYARKDGAYEGMLVGSALNLQGHNEVANSSMYRPAGGTDDIATGLAEIKSIRGNSICWNQLVDRQIPWDKLDISSQYANKYVVRHVIKKQKGVRWGHKCLIIVNVSITDGWDKNKEIQLGIGTAASPYNNTGGIKITKNKQTLCGIAKITQYSERNTSTHAYLLINTDEPDNNILNYIEISDGQVFDLTLIYGEGNEPTTPEQFDADYQRWFGKSLSLGYEEYDEGSIRSVLATGIKTVGFNLWDKGVYDFTNADRWPTIWKNNIGYTGQIYFQADIETLEDPNVVDDATTAANVLFMCNDGVSRSLGMMTYKGRIYGVSPKGFQVRYIHLNVGHFASTKTIIRFSNVCVNMCWSGKRDGEYEPYWNETKSLPITEISGKIDGEGDSAVIFPDGMKRVGNVCDEIFVENGVTKAIKRIGSVELSTLPGWRIEGTRFSAWYSIPNLAKYGFYTTPGLWAKYVQNFERTEVDYKFRLGGANESKVGSIFVSDSLIKDLDAFKESLQGEILYYELEEPITYVVDDFELPIVYKVDDFGTEQIVSPESSVAPTIMTRYGMNAVDTLRRLPTQYISMESMDNFLSKLNAAMNGVWVKTWDESTGSYVFNFTPNNTESINELTD